MMVRHVKLASFLIASIGLTMLLGACETSKVHFRDTSAIDGDPLIVASKISVDVTDYKSAVSGSGGRTERKDISGYVLTPVGAYMRQMDDIKRMGAAIAAAEAAVVNATKVGIVYDEYARACRQDPVCDKIAAARVDAKLKAVK